MKSLRVATAYDDGSWALAVNVFEGAAHHAFGNKVSAAGEVVGGEESSVIDALDCEVAAVCLAELIS